MSAPGSTRDEQIEALHGKAASLHQDGRFSDEAEVWREICQIEADNPYWLHNLALSLLHSDRLEECVSIFAHLLQVDSDLPRVHNNFAIAALRLGMSSKFVTPHFVQAFVLSQDEDEFYRHLMNSCNSIVYGFDDWEEAEASLDILADCVVRLVEERCEPRYRTKNRDYLMSLIDAYRHVARFRCFFANTKWEAAERELAVARHELSQMGLDNFVRGLESIEGTFALARDISAYVEDIAAGRYDDPTAAFSTCVVLQRKCRRDSNEPGKYFAFQRLRALLIGFLDGMATALCFLDGKDYSLSYIKNSREIVHSLSAQYFSTLGQDLLTALRALDNVCFAVATSAGRRANRKLAHDHRHAAWERICLLFNGLHLDFRAVDVALARGYLGWIYDPKREGIRVVQGFKSFVERQAWRDLYVNGNPQENIARALLQAYLLPRNYREVPVKGGRSDVLMLERDGRFVFETKIWRGASYFNAGLSEIKVCRWRKR